MKKYLSIIVIIGLTGCLVTCKGPSQKTPSMSKTSFGAVTSRLDEGGSLYLYLSTEKITKGVEDLGGKLRAVIESQDIGSPAEKEEILGIVDFVFALIKKIGLTEMSGIGMSSVSMDENLNHSKLVVHHYEEEGKGLIWQMWEEKPHALSGLKLLPADTVLAQFSDCRLNQLWQFIKTEAEASGISKFKQGVEALGQLLDKQGIPLDAVLESLGGSMGFLLTLDSQNKSAVPMGQTSMEIPNPGLAIVLGVKDDTLFDLLKSKLTFAEESEDKGIKKLKVPALPVPFPFQPEIVQSDGLLILASHASVTEAMVAARDQGNGLTATQEFKDLSKNIPDRGNSFRFMGSRFYQQIKDIQKAAMQASGMPQEGGMGAAQILDMFSEGMTWYGVLQNTDEGLVYTFNHSLDLEYIGLMSAAGAVGIGVALVVPKILSARMKQQNPWPQPIR